MRKSVSNYRYFTTEDAKWSLLPVKLVSNLCLTIQIVAVRPVLKLLFEFSIWVLNFARVYFQGSLISRLLQRPAKLRTSKAPFFTEKVPISNTFF